MIDITAEIEVRELERKPGKVVADELYYRDRLVGKSYPQGWVFSDPHYQWRFRPNHVGVFEGKVFMFTDAELETMSER